MSTATKTLTLTAPVDITAAASGDDTARISVLAYTGGPMRVAGFGPVLIATDGLDTGRQTTLQVDHDPTLMAGTVGHGSARIEAGQVTIDGVLYRGQPPADSIIKMFKAGRQLQASVGVEVIDSKHITGPATIEANGRSHTLERGQRITHVTRGILKEVSIVSSGADSNTSVSIAAKDSKMSTDTEHVEDSDVITTERNRIKAIEAACRGNWGSHESRVAELRARAIDDEITLENLQAELLATLRASRPTGPAIHSVTVDPRYGKSFAFAPPGGDRIQLQAASLLLHAGRDSWAEKCYGGEVCNRAEAMRGWTMIDHMKHDLEARGVFTGRLTPAEILASGGFSTTSLPVALGDALNKTALQLYKEAKASYRLFTAIRGANDFRDHNDIRLSSIETLQKIGPDGEIKSSTLGENPYTWRIDTFARLLRFTRQSIINDSAGANLFEQIPQGIVKASVRAVSDLVIQTLLANAGSFFHANNSNLLTGAGSALDSASLSNAIELLRKQTDERDYELDLEPAALLVPPELETTARELINSTFVERDVATGGDKLPTGNVHNATVSLVIESRLSSPRFSGSSATQWYLFSDPDNGAMVTAFLNRREAPIVEVIGPDSDPQTLGSGWRAYSDFGSALGDPVAAVKSAGA